METSTKWVIGGLVGAVALYLVWPKKASAATLASPTVPLSPKPGTGPAIGPVGPTVLGGNDAVTSIRWTAFKYSFPQDPRYPQLSNPYTVYVDIHYQSGNSASQTADLVDLPYMTAKQVTPDGLPDASSVTYNDGSHDPIGFPDAATRATILASVNKLLAAMPTLAPGFPPAQVTY